MSKEIDKTKIITTIISGFFGLLSSLIPILITNISRKQIPVVASVHSIPEDIEREDVAPMAEETMPTVPLRLESPMTTRIRTIETVEHTIIKDEILAPTNIIIIVSAIGIAIVLGLTILKKIRRKK